MTTFYGFVYKIFCKFKLLLWTFINLIRLFCAYVRFKLFMIVHGPPLETIWGPPLEGQSATKCHI